jgi:hypothetical protein
MPTTRPASDHDELQTLDPADLTRVTGGAGDDLSTMMMAMAMRKRGQAAAAPAPAPAVPSWQPTITVDGVPQQLTSTGNGTFSTPSSASGDPSQILA